MRKYFITLAIVFGTIFLGTVSLTIYQLQQQEKIFVDDQIIAGKLVWQREGCVECHTIFGNGGYTASDLTKITKRRNEDWLKEYFRNPPVMPPSQEQHHPGLPEGDVVPLLAFFRWVAELDTNGWPPGPNVRVERASEQN